VRAFGNVRAKLTAAAKQPARGARHHRTRAERVLLGRAQKGVENHGILGWQECVLWHAESRGHGERGWQGACARAVLTAKGQRFQVSRQADIYGVQEARSNPWQQQHQRTCHLTFFSRRFWQNSYGVLTAFPPCLGVRFHPLRHDAAHIVKGRFFQDAAHQRGEAQMAYPAETSANLEPIPVASAPLNFILSPHGLADAFAEPFSSSDTADAAHFSPMALRVPPVKRAASSTAGSKAKHDRPSLKANSKGKRTLYMRASVRWLATSRRAADASTSGPEAWCLIET